MMMIGYFEGLGSERGIAWRVSDSLSLRRFLGMAITEETPDHSTLSVIRRRLPEESRTGGKGNRRYSGGTVRWRPGGADHLAWRGFAPGFLV